MRAVDLFAGAGGFTTGAKAAGAQVVWAANHWPAAVAIHAANHPRCTRVRIFSKRTGTAFPDMTSCWPHPLARATLSLAWAVVSALEAGRAPVAIVENVPEFRRWTLYPAWLEALRLLGYTAAEHIIDAADLGVPQRRVRLFIVLTRSAHPLRLVVPSRPRGQALDIINFDAGRWDPVVRPGRAAATLARYEAGRREHGRRFLLPYYGTARGGRSLKEPIGTITTSANHHAVVDGDKMRMLLASEVQAAMGFPESYHLPERRTLAVHLLGNAVCPPVAQALVEAVEEQA